MTPRSVLLLAVALVALSLAVVVAQSRPLYALPKGAAYILPFGYAELDQHCKLRHRLVLHVDVPPHYGSLHSWTASYRFDTTNPVLKHCIGRKRPHVFLLYKAGQEAGYRDHVQITLSDGHGVAITESFDVDIVDGPYGVAR